MSDIFPKFFVVAKGFRRDVVYELTSMGDWRVMSRAVKGSLVFTHHVDKVKEQFASGAWAACDMEGKLLQQPPCINIDMSLVNAGEEELQAGGQVQPLLGEQAYNAPLGSPTLTLGYNDLNSLKEAWKATIHGDGGDCPVCSRFGKVYERTINETMAGALKWLYDMAQTDPRAWINCPASMPKEYLRSNQHTTLRWWGLVERKPVDPSEKTKTKHSGLWRITLKGMDFVEGRCHVPERVATYDGEVVSTSKEVTLFKDCKGGFDFSAVMSTTHHTLGRSLFPANDSKADAA